MDSKSRDTPTPQSVAGGRDAWRDAQPTCITKCNVRPCHSSPTCKPLGRLADWTHSRYILGCFAEHRPGSILYIVACRLPPDRLPGTRRQWRRTLPQVPSAKCQAPCSLTWPPFAVLHLSAPRIRSPRHSPVEWALGQFPGSSGWLTKLARHSHSAGTPT